MSGIIWAIVHHFLAGIRHLLLDLHLGLSNESASRWGISVTSLAIAIAIIFCLGFFDIIFS
jgi:succinate dehydrogenase / fumarate reductase cytochrome b subunit